MKEPDFPPIPEPTAWEALLIIVVPLLALAAFLFAVANQPVQPSKDKHDSTIFVPNPSGSGLIQIP